MSTQPPNAAPTAPTPPLLYVCATPIGNLGDTTPRTLEVLRQSTLIFAEDTRSALRLLRHFDIQSQLESCHKHNEYLKTEHFSRYLERHRTIALLAEAGTPGISDPGRHLVQAAWDAGCRVVPLPGASAVTTALSAAGFETTPFTFWGFVPAKPKEREGFWSAVESAPGAQVFFATPRNAATVLAELAELFPGRTLLVCRELTKLHETLSRSVLPNVPQVPELGEFTLVLSAAEEQQQAHGDEFLLHLSTKDHLLVHVLERGRSRKEAIALVARERRLPRREVYKIALTLDQG